MNLRFHSSTILILMHIFWLLQLIDEKIHWIHISIDDSPGKPGPTGRATSPILLWPSDSDPRLAHDPAQEPTLCPCLHRPAAHASHSVSRLFPSCAAR